MRNLMVEIILLLLFTSCSNKNYYGYVYDFDEEVPIKGVIVSDSSQTFKIETNSEGYFELKKEKLSDDYLFFSKKNYKTTKIRTISIQNGEFMDEQFKGQSIFLIKQNTN